MEAFLASLSTSVVGERMRPDSVRDVLAPLLASWDGRRPVSALPLHEQFERLHGKDVAAAASLELKTLAEKHGVLVDLPTHLKTLRLQDRQELLARYHPRPAAAATAAASVPATEPAATDPSAAPTPAPSAPSARRRVVGIPAACAALLLVAYLVVRFIALERGAADDTSWRPAVLPPDPAALPCVSLRGAGDVVECTMSVSVFSSLAKAELDARAARTHQAVLASGKKRLRIRTDDGVMRGAR